ncbi:agmatinase [Candidatus Bathyarchaeota archaeon]|nr:agmatinase [Candidatus Bathyarchaeota archaeon]
MSYRELACQRFEFGGFGKKAERARYSIIGVPYDFTSTYRPGSRFGPNAIREASLNLEAYSLRNAFDVESVSIEDLGDLNVLTDASATTELLRKIVIEIVAEGKFPIILGGEHSITYGSARAFNETAILSFDAHLDLRDEYLGNKFSHATFMHRLFEVFGPEKIFEVGPRALSPEELTFAKENKIQFLTTREVEHLGIERVTDKLKQWVSQFESLYVTVDMDILDPAYAPGVGNPVPEGLSPTKLLDLLQGICGPKVVGFDVVEISPIYDSGITALQAANIIYNVLAFRETANT